MDAERTIDTDTGERMGWRAVVGGSVLRGRCKLSILIALFLLLGAIPVALAPLV